VRLRLVIVAAVVIAALVGYPLRHGSAYLDDFVFIALARHIDNPLALLVQDSLGAFFFRPLGMFLWWVTVALFGNDAPAHLAFNMAVHAANGVVLFALLRQLRVSSAPAAAAGLLFIAHPAAFAAAAWLSDRFDLFATLFGLAALNATDRFLEKPSRARLATTVLAMLAALFSKEIGFAFPAVAALMIAWIQPSRHMASRRQRLALFIAIAACALVALGVRPLVLRNVTETMLLRDGIAATLWGGLAKWTQNLSGFLVVFQGNVASIAAWLALFVGVLAAALMPGPRALLRSGDGARGAACGIAIMAMSALAQAPIVHASPIAQFSLWHSIAEHAVFAPLAASRFYYLSIAGFAVLAGVLGETLVRSAPKGARAALLVLALASAAGMVASDRAIGRDWVAFVEWRDTPIVRDAVALLAEKRDVRPGCKIYLLGTPEDSLPFRSLMDTAVKQGLPKGHPVVGCFIQGEHTPWYHLVTTRGLAPGAEKPLEIMQFGGKPYPPLAVGNLAYYYLNVPDRPEVRDDPAATFYAWEGDKFVDVTDAVRSRRRAVKFFNNRPPL
jgi:hypothetical protein